MAGSRGRTRHILAGKCRFVPTLLSQQGNCICCESCDDAEAFRGENLCVIVENPINLNLMIGFDGGSFDLNANRVCYEYNLVSIY